jgi:acetyltransferase
MKKVGLKNFFQPKTIAVIGASDHEHKVGGILMKKLLDFKGKIIPINPKHRKISGEKAYPSITKYHKKIDLAIIAIPAKFVKKALQNCGTKKIKNVIIISAGFSEVGNKKAEQEIIQIAKRYKINLLGPNCFGVANPYLNLDTTFANKSSKKGNIAFISQSGALWSYLSDISKLGFSGFVSLGNIAHLNFSDFVEYFDKDKQTKKIILYMEKLKQGKRFIDICRKSKKEIIVVKAGKSKKGSEAVISHTGSLATDFKIYENAFKQAGIKQVESLSDVFKFEKLKLPKLKEKKTFIITNAGGAGALITDCFVEKGFDVEPPIDLLGTALAKDYEKTLNKLKNKKANFVVILTPQKMSEPKKTAEAIIKTLKNKSVITYFLGEDSVKEAKNILTKNKIPCFTKI